MQSNTFLPFCLMGRCLVAQWPSNPPVCWLLLWAACWRIPVFIGGRTGCPLRPQTAISPSQTADLPLQTLCVSCLPDGNRMKSTADDEEKPRTKGRCERGLVERPRANYIFPARVAIQSSAQPCVCLFVWLIVLLFVSRKEAETE